MGHSKRLLEEAAARNYSLSEGFVCQKCVNDPHLAKELADALTSSRCSYCGRRPGAPMDVLLAALQETIEYYYHDPANELYYDGREGGYQGEWWDGYDFIQDEFNDWTDDSSLKDDVASAFGQSAWCRKNSFAFTPYEALGHGWTEFVRQVKHHTRYLFFPEPKPEHHNDVDGVSPSQMLQAIGQLCLDFGLIHSLPAGQVLLRARVIKPDVRLKEASEIGPPPADVATMPNRMSPAGIPMFYGALDATTAQAETFDPTMGTNVSIAIGRFRALRALQVLNLLDLPKIPSVFDSQNRFKRGPLMFLHDFSDDLSKPIRRDGREHFEYAPTQVVTEYFRHRFKVGDSLLDGVLYRSSRTGKAAFVLFATAEQCVAGDEWGGPEQLLELLRIRHKKPRTTGERVAARAS